MEVVVIPMVQGFTTKIAIDRKTYEKFRRISKEKGMLLQFYIGQLIEKEVRAYDDDKNAINLNEEERA